ncbi:hypothetical protein LSAT2_004916 [Lamellibrachia satsuma]|nr:hypothetical protein LSAT2_004916 [Lamellibrachia satsuma]
MAQQCSLGLLVCCLFAMTTAKMIIRDDKGTPALEIVFSQNATLRYRDQYTGAHDYISIYEPNISPSGFKFLGQRAQPNWKDLSAPILMAKDISGELSSRILVDPEDFTEIWRDQGGTGDMDVAFWKAKCPEGFVALSDLAYACSRFCGWPKPDWYKAFMKCVRRDFVEECLTTIAPIWTNYGGFERIPGSVWGVEATNGVRNTGFWYGSQGHRVPPYSGRGYCLKQFEKVDN